MRQMVAGRNVATLWLRAAMAFASIATAGILAAAQSPAPQNAQAKSPTTSLRPEKEDLLAPLLQQANDAIDKMDFAAAIDPLQKYIAQRPDEAFPHFQLGYAYVGLQRGNEAKQEFSRAIALDPKMAEAHQNLGLLEMNTDPAAAAEAFRRAAELQPTESRPRFLAARSLERLGKLPEAIEQYRSGLAISPKSYEAHHALGRVLLRSKDAAGAEEQFRAALELRPGDVPATLGLATSLLDQKKFEAASTAFDEYLKSDSGNDDAHYQRTEALINLGRYDDALSELDRVKTGGPLSAAVAKKRGELYMHLKNWKEAETALKQAVSLAPQDEDAAEFLGDVEIELHNYPDAIRVLEQVIARNPRASEAFNDLANAYYLTENYAAALDLMDRLAKLETPAPGSWFIRAICYDKLSRKAEAIEAYQKFLDQDRGQHDTQDFQARQRILFLQKELGQAKKK